MANSVRIIDTGQTLGTNVVIKEDKVLSSGNADISSPSSLITTPILGVTSPTDVNNMDSSQQQVSSSLQEPKVYFATQGGGVKLHRDNTGQVYLSLRPTAVTVLISLALLGAVGLLFVRKILVTKNSGPATNISEEAAKTETVMEKAETEVQPEAVDASTRSQVRRLSL